MTMEVAMLKRLAGLAIAGLFLATRTAPAAAQDVRLDVSWGTPGLHASATFWSGGLREVGGTGYDGRYAPRPVRVERRHYTECVADGPYLYCWDAPRVYRGRAVGYVRPVVHVYVTDRAVAYRHGRGRHGWSRGYVRWHEAAATRYWRHWADAHRYAYDRDRLMVDVRLAW
jgi:hypothetical protein